MGVFIDWEDAQDIRNSKVVDIVRELREYGVDVLVYDPMAASREVLDKYGLDLICL